jgi:hypothetical protein
MNKKIFWQEKNKTCDKNNLTFSPHSNLYNAFHYYPFEVTFVLSQKLVQAPQERSTILAISI